MAMSRLWIAYPATTALVGLTYLLGPDQVNVGPVFNVIGASAALAIIWGARRNLERGRLPWYIFAAGQLLFVTGDVLAYNHELFFGRELSFPSIADPFYLAVYPCAVAGLLILTHRRDPSRDRASLIDSLIVAIGIGTLSWVYLMAPYAHDGSLALHTKLISLAYPFMDLLVFAVMVRLAVAAGRRELSFGLLLLGICALSVTDTIYGGLLLHGGYETGGLLDGGWIAFYVLLGTAALHPSMRVLTEPTRAIGHPPIRQRLILLVFATLLVPAVGVARLLSGDSYEIEVVLASSAALFSLVMWRMAGLMRQQERARRREVALRHAAEELMAATSRESVYAASRAAARDLQAHGGHTSEVEYTLGALERETARALESLMLTERHARERSELRFSSLVRHASDVVCILDADTSIRYISQSVERVAGYDAEAMTGKRLIEFVHPEDCNHVLTVLAHAAREDAAQPTALEFRVRDTSGSWHHLETLATNLTDDPGVAGVVLNARDISDRKAFERELSHQALHDRLTGLANRVLFRDRVSQALARQQRAANATAVLFLDLDDFKSINDSLGHSAGDELLCEVARRIAACVRASDSAARLGGDEFAVLLDAVADGPHAAEIAVRIMQAVSEPVLIDGHELLVNTSIGIALDSDSRADAGAGDFSADALLRNADAAMYLAKGQGKNRYHMFEPAMHDAAVRRLQLKTDLRRAIDNGELFVQYQPIVRLDTADILGVEALVRWQHPERGVVSPGDFIPIAEESGLIVQLGEFVLRTACRDIRALQAQRPGQPPLTVAVNMSARELQQRHIVDSVRIALEESGLAAECLVIELTESVMMQDMDLAVLCMHDLRQLGVRLAIDDFGTGYSSLTYVRQFPIDLLKIDRSFIQDVSEDGQTSALTASIIDLAHILELTPVAEGIETPAQLERLKALGCELGQGFHLHRPMPLQDLSRMLLTSAGSQVSA
jgi:diguanylate cyclase (GGDEF)-like protein/PAS domain S-box-containing protein